MVCPRRVVVLLKEKYAGKNERRSGHGLVATVNYTGGEGGGEWVDQRFKIKFVYLKSTSNFGAI